MGGGRPCPRAPSARSGADRASGGEGGVLLDPEAVPRAPRAGPDPRAAPDPGDVDAPEILVSDPVTGSERAQVGRVDVGHEARGSLLEQAAERERHPRPVEAQPAVPRVRET